MGRFTIRWHISAGVVTIAVFLILLSIRLGWLTLDEGPGLARPMATLSPVNNEIDDVWMNILQDGKKIGYAHRSLRPQGYGYNLADVLFMKINTMGVVQGMVVSTQALLNGDMTLASFRMELQSNLFRFETKGELRGRKLYLYAGPPGEPSRYEIVVKEAPYMVGGALEKAVREILGRGGSVSLPVFDPASLTVRPIKVFVAGREERMVEGRKEMLTRLSVDFMGGFQTAWVDGRGRIVREEGALGLAMERTTRDRALAGLTGGFEAGADLTESAAIPSDVELKNPASLTFLKVSLENIDVAPFALQGGRQRLKDAVLSIHREDATLVPHSTLIDRDRFLISTPFVQADHPQIVELSEKITKKSAPDNVKAREIVSWVYRNIGKRPVLSVSNAVETLNRRMGDCTEHAVLVAALGRAAGLPTAIESGLVYQRGKFYYHAWNAFFIEDRGGWITADAVMEQMPADVTHIRFVRGEGEEQLNMLGLMGKLRIRVLEAR